MEELRGVVEMQGRETPACPTAIHTAAEAAANQTTRMSRNPGAMSLRSIPTKHRRHAMRADREAEAMHRNRLQTIAIPIDIHRNHNHVAAIHTPSNRNRAITTGLKPTSRAPSGPKDRMPIRVLEISPRNSNSAARLEGMPILTKTAVKKSMIGRKSSIGAVAAIGLLCRK
jgi:hypothetical protein